MQPKLFDTRANDFEPEEIVQPWKQIDLDPEYAGAWFVAGDLDGDGEVEIVSSVGKGPTNRGACQNAVHANLGLRY